MPDLPEPIRMAATACLIWPLAALPLSLLLARMFPRRGGE